MPEPILNGPRIVSRIGKSIAAGMSEHVDVNIVVEAGTLTDALTSKPRSYQFGQHRAFNCSANVVKRGLDPSGVKAAQ